MSNYYEELVWGGEKLEIPPSQELVQWLEVQKEYCLASLDGLNYDREQIEQAIDDLLYYLEYDQPRYESPYSPFGTWQAFMARQDSPTAVRFRPPSNWVSGNVDISFLREPHGVLLMHVVNALRALSPGRDTEVKHLWPDQIANIFFHIGALMNQIFNLDVGKLSGETGGRESIVTRAVARAYTQLVNGLYQNVEWSAARREIVDEGPSDQWGDRPIFGGGWVQDTIGDVNGTQSLLMRKGFDPDHELTDEYIDIVIGYIADHPHIVPGYRVHFDGDTDELVVYDIRTAEQVGQRVKRDSIKKTLSRVRNRVRTGDTKTS